MTNELKEELEHLNRKGALPPVFTGRSHSAESLSTMNINSSSNGLSWTAPVPHFFFFFFLLLLLLFIFFIFLFFSFYIIYIFFLFFLSLSEEVFLTAVCAFERQTKFVKS